MKETQLFILGLLFFLGLKMEAQVVELPFNELYLDGKLIYGDSLALSEKRMNVYCCDTNGLKLDSCKGLFYFKYKKFTWIVDATQYKDSNKYSKFVVESIKSKKWSSPIRRPKCYQILGFYDYRTSNWLTIVIRKGEMRVFHLF